MEDPRRGVALDAHDPELGQIVRRVDVLEDVPLVRPSLVRLDVRVHDLARFAMNHDESRQG